ncbi:transposase [Salmonirosea aquatica]|uniref:Transposase n=1 Tax=Salmonirosea aquatica TaxID=2654236 RepID=A0A7C9BFE6_9BACT|nr:transposase [Cytophagaceae bacterium SJW1-29]
MATSVVGIGTQTALALMIYTDGFTLFARLENWLAMPGVAPFVYASGTRVKGRTRVSKMANMDLKTALHMASLTAVKLDVQLKPTTSEKLPTARARCRFSTPSRLNFSTESCQWSDENRNMKISLISLWFCHRNHGIET